MILLTITIIMLILKLSGLIAWSYWIVFFPLIVEGAFATWLFIQAEFEYVKNFGKEKDIEEIEI